MAFYINSHERPQDPRYTGDVHETREKHANSHGHTVYGSVLNTMVTCSGITTIPARRASCVRRSSARAPSTDAIISRPIRREAINAPERWLSRGAFVSSAFGPVLLLPGGGQSV